MARSARPAKDDARRGALLDAAARVFFRYGFAKTSMDDVARAAGLSRQGLYLHFPSKEAVFTAAVAHLVSGAVAAGAAALVGPAPLEQRLLAGFSAWHALHFDHAIPLERQAELFAAAAEHGGAVVTDAQAAFVKAVAQVLRGAGIGGRGGPSATQIAATLDAASSGLKHTVQSKDQYQKQMATVIRVVVGKEGDMNVVVFGATGMIGSGVLLECLADPAITRVVSMVRKPTGMTHAKLTEVEHTDYTDLSVVEGKLAGLDACFFCLGISSVGLDEAAYTKITYDTALAAGRLLAKLNPALVFCFVSGASTDATEKSSTMWARVKGKTENDLQKLPLKVFCFRPAFIQPIKGVVSKTGLYRAFYAVFRPLTPLLVRFAPGIATTTEVLGKAMIKAARSGAPKTVLESADINALVA